MSILEESMQNNDAVEVSETPTPVSQVSIYETIRGLLQIPTGVGSLEEYINSPLNFDGSEGLARILRGLAGFIGADVVRSAVVDIIFGLIQWVGGRVKHAQG